MHSINVTPLTDVLLVLLITFLLTSSSFQEGSEPVPLPRVAELREVSDQLTTVSVGREGAIAWPFSGAAVSDPAGGFRRLREQAVAPTLALAVDRELAYQKLYPVLMAARQAGWQRIVLLTEATP